MEPSTDMEFNPLRDGESLLKKLDALLPKMLSALNDLCIFREQVENGGFDWHPSRPKIDDN